LFEFYANLNLEIFIVSGVSRPALGHTQRLLHGYRRYSDWS